MTIYILIALQGLTLSLDTTKDLRTACIAHKMTTGPKLLLKVHQERSIERQSVFIRYMTGAHQQFVERAGDIEILAIGCEHVQPPKVWKWREAPATGEK